MDTAGWSGLNWAVPDRRFEQLVRTHHRAVHTYARSIASDPSVVDDAVQETFIKAWRHLDSFRGDGNFEGWLIRICRNCVIDIERREARARSAVDRQLRLLRPPTSTTMDDTSELAQLIDALPRSHREVLTVCGVLGYDYEAAAQILDIPVGTVRSRLHRARQALEQLLEPGTNSQDERAS